MQAFSWVLSHDTVPTTGLWGSLRPYHSPYYSADVQVMVGALCVLLCFTSDTALVLCWLPRDT